MKPFSFFPRGIRSTIPYREPETLQSIYSKITSEVYRAETNHLREMIKNNASKEDISKFKSSNFHYICVSGTFIKRSDDSLIEHSGLICLDLDKLDDVEKLFDLIIHDTELNPLLVFRSPSGNGIKVVVEMPPDKSQQVDVFNQYSSHIYHNYRIKPDAACTDVSRACFLPYDPNAYINPALMSPDAH